jgi:hypothetical protein
VSVEFLSTDAPTAEPEPARHRHGWWLVAALLAITLATWALTRPAAPGTPNADAACRGVPDCAVQTVVPPAISSAVQAYLSPRARLRVRTVTGENPLTQRHLLVERNITVGADSVTVVIRMQRGGSTARAIVPDPPGVGSLLLHDVNSGFVVRLQYLAPETVPPVLDRLRALMRDPRLASA